MKPLQHWAADAELGLEELEKTARPIMGNEPVPWSWSYLVILAVNV